MCALSVDVWGHMRTFYPGTGSSPIYTLHNFNSHWRSGCCSPVCASAAPHSRLGIVQNAPQGLIDTPRQVCLCWAQVSRGGSQEGCNAAGQLLAAHTRFWFMCFSYTSVSQVKIFKESSTLILMLVMIEKSPRKCLVTVYLGGDHFPMQQYQSASKHTHSSLE